MKIMKKLTIVLLTAVFYFPINAYCKGSKPVQFYLSADVYRVEPQENINVVLTYPARLESYKRVDVVARVSGVLEHKYFKEGQLVKKGALLFKIEPDIYKANYDSKKASLRMAKARLFKAEKDLLRYKKLFKQKAISQQKMDYILSAYENAKAMVDEASAQLRAAKIDLDYTQVRAPITGVAGLKLESVGEYVTKSTKLTTITQTKPIYAMFAFPDSDIMKIKEESSNGLLSEGKKIKAYIVQNHHKYKGYVDFIDVDIDKSTSTTKARAIFDNKDNELMPGGFVRINVVGYTKKNVLIIPQKALLQNQMGKIVFIIKHGRVAVRPVKVENGANDTFIVTWGLKPGDLVIVNNFFKIKPGMPIKIGKVINKK